MALLFVLDKQLEAKSRLNSHFVEFPRSLPIRRDVSCPSKLTVHIDMLDARLEGKES